MNASAMRELLHRQPFLPFEIRMSNGDVHNVRHPEFALLAGNTLILYYPDSDRISMLSLLHINGVETPELVR